MSARRAHPGRGTPLGRVLLNRFVAREMGVGWLRRLTRSWERDLAFNFAWAFRRGLAGLLSSTFEVPAENIDDSDKGIVSIDTTACIKSLADEEKDAMNEFVEGILEENLRLLYAGVAPSITQIKFKMQLISFKLEDVFLIPVLTRDNVKKDNSLKGAYQAIKQEFAASGSIRKVYEMVEELIKACGLSGNRSIIADVSIRCMETFQVRDAATGSLIQGSESEKGEEVTHVVRFEMVTTRGSSGERILGSWKITDWDDLLGGNVWH